MEDWRIYALSFFPFLGADLIDEDFYSYYQLFFDLYGAHKLHRSDDYGQLRKLYAFARWCLFHEDSDIRNAAGVAFYEHLFDKREDWDRVAPRVREDDEVVAACWPLWIARKQPAEISELRVALGLDSAPE